MSQKPSEKSAPTNPFTCNQAQTAPAVNGENSPTKLRIHSSLYVNIFANSLSTASDAPPAYSAAPPAPPSTSGLSPLTAGRAVSPAPSASSRGSRLTVASITNDNDPYAFLSTFDTVFLIDDSGSMAGRNWREARDVLRSITEICTQRDQDGIDVYFLNHRSGNKGGAGQADGGYYNITDAASVQRIFESVKPQRTTPTGQRLRSMLKPYLEQLQSAADMDDVKPVNVIVITDGEPTDEPETDIVQAARKLDRLDAPAYQVGIQFFQVGNDQQAAEYLRTLDDDLEKHGVRDMVDTVSWQGTTGVLTAEGILKVVLGAVMRRLDRRSM